MQGTITRSAHAPAESPPSVRKIKGIGPNGWWFLQTVTALLIAASAGTPGGYSVNPGKGIC